MLGRRAVAPPQDAAAARSPSQGWPTRSATAGRYQLTRRGPTRDEPAGDKATTMPTSAATIPARLGYREIEAALGEIRVEHRSGLPRTRQEPIVLDDRVPRDHLQQHRDVAHQVDVTSRQFRPSASCARAWRYRPDSEHGRDDDTDDGDRRVLSSPTSIAVPYVLAGEYGIRLSLISKPDSRQRKWNPVWILRLCRLISVLRTRKEADADHDPPARQSARRPPAHPGRRRCDACCALD